MRDLKDAFAATQPQVFLVVFKNPVYDIVKQAIARGVSGELSVLHAIQATAISANPQRAVRVFIERDNSIARESVLGCEGGELFIREFT